MEIECHRGSLKRTLLWLWLNEDNEESLFACQGQRQTMLTKKTNFTKGDRECHDLIAVFKFSQLLKTYLSGVFYVF